MKRLESPIREWTFRQVVLAETVSLAGSAMTPVALTFGVLAVGGSPTALGLVLAVNAAAFALCLLPAGVVADRVSRSRLMACMAVVQCVGQVVIATLLITGNAATAYLAIVTGVGGAAAAFAGPAASGLVLETVPRELLQRANALLYVVRSIVGIAGPALGGLLVVAIGPGWTIAADAATYLIAAVILARLSRRLTTDPMPTDIDFVAALSEGLREIASRTWLWAMIGNAALFVLGVLGPLYVLGPVVAQHVYGGAAGWGGILAAYGAGAVAGGLIASRLLPRRPLVHAVVISFLFAPLMAAIATESPLFIVIMAAILAGFGNDVYLILWETTVQQEISPRVISRVLAVDWFGNRALMPIGLALASPLASVIGTSTVLWGAVAVVVGTGLCNLSVRSVRDLSRPRARSDTSS